MPEQLTNPSSEIPIQIDAARLTLESERLRLENERIALEKQRAYLDQWDRSTAPLHEHAVEMSKAAIGFAQGALRTTFLLNGGALVALPTFSAIFHAGTKSIAALLGMSIGCFVTGLVACVVAHLFSFFATSGAAQNRDAKVELEKIRINLQHNRITKEAAETDRQKSEAVRATRERQTKQWERVAIISLFSSIALFVAGSVVGAIRLIE